MNMHVRVLVALLLLFVLPVADHCDDGRINGSLIGNSEEEYRAQEEARLDELCAARGWRR